MKRMRISLGKGMALIVACLLVATGFTIAASRSSSAKPVQELQAAQLPTKTVPDVAAQPYIFAESTLQMSGFGWRVEGKVEGWAEARVSSQIPAAGTVVMDTGAPLVKLQLEATEGYQHGTPENTSPYKPTRVIVAPTSLSSETTSTAETTTTSVEKPATTTKPALTKPAKANKPKPQSGERTRPRAFVIAGAHPEPLDEIPLPVRARNLNRWLDSHRRVSDANVNHWLYQHAWVVTGAKFGWWHGAQALEILIAVDRRIQRLWGVGWKSEAEARSALEFVRAHGG
jgi:hypothetical protein